MLKLSVDDLRSRFDPAYLEVEDIYPSGPRGDESVEDALDYFLTNLSQLRGFLDEVTKASLGFVLWLG